MAVTLRARFGIWIGGVVTLAVVGHMGALLTSEARHLARQAELAHWTATRHLSQVCAEAAVQRVDLPVLNLFKELRRSGAFVDAACLDEGGVVFLHSDLSRDAGKSSFRPLPAAPEKEVDNPGGQSRTAYTVPAERGGQRVAAARVVFDDGETKSAVHALLVHVVRRSAGTTALTLLGAIGLAWIAARTLTRPILELAAGTRRLSSGDWSARVREDAPGEIGHLAREFNALSLRLGELDALKDQLLHTVSHDLRNPLGAITTLTRMLKTDDLPDRSRSAIEAIEAAIVRLGALLNNILDSARLKDGPLVFRKENVLPAKLFSELDRLYRPLADQSGKTFSVEVPADAPVILGDEEKVFRILINLLTNAFKFTREGNRITLSLAAAPGGVDLCVADTGPGLDPERVPRLFQPFRTGRRTPEDAHAGEGTGLGLFIVKVLAEGQGGSVRVDSFPGRGAVFTVRLPAAGGHR